MDLEEGVAATPQQTDEQGILSRGPSHRFSKESHHQHHHNHTHEEHVAYDTNAKVEFVPPVEGTPAALALAGKFLLQ